MPSVVTINRSEVVALIERAAQLFTGGNKTAAVELALRRLLEHEARAGSLYGAHPGSVRVGAGTDLLAPVLGDPLDAEGEPLAAALAPPARARAASAKGYRA
ncbi:MAG: type II toxin-antitoxin system VapB family antitoxin, partial [Terriglobales bacterium]